jgi:hypothetical protein
MYVCMYICMYVSVNTVDYCRQYPSRSVLTHLHVERKKLETVKEIDHPCELSVIF